jgi:hypothetical protein
MDEVFPVVMGVVVGVVFSFSQTWSLGWRFGALGIVAAAVAATWLSGEYAVSPLYLILDLAEAGLGAAVGILIATRWRAGTRRRS